MGFYHSDPVQMLLITKSFLISQVQLITSLSVFWNNSAHICHSSLFTGLNLSLDFYPFEDWGGLTYLWIYKHNKCVTQILCNSKTFFNYIGFNKLLNILLQHKLYKNCTIPKCSTWWVIKCSQLLSWNYPPESFSVTCQRGPSVLSSRPLRVTVPSPRPKITTYRS